MSYVCNYTYRTLGYCFLPFSIICCITTLPVVYHFISIYISSGSGSKQSRKSLFYVGLLFLISTFMVLLLICVSVAVECNKLNSSIQPIVLPSLFLFVMIQSYLLLLILFMRLHFVFLDTALALSQITVTSLYGTFCLFPVILVSAAMIHALQTRTMLDAIFIMLTYFIIIVLIISLVTLFIYKLIQVYKNVDKDILWITTITKNTILSLISISFTILTPIGLIIENIAPSEYTKWTMSFMALFDVYTNFICIILSYNQYSKYYEIICGCLDKKCKLICAKCLGLEAKIMIMLNEDTKDKTCSNSSLPTMELSIDETQTQQTVQSTDIIS